MDHYYGAQSLINHQNMVMASMNASRIHPSAAAAHPLEHLPQEHIDVVLRDRTRAERVQKWATQNGASALGWAVTNGSAEDVNALARCGVDVNLSSGAALRNAAKMGKTKVMNALLVNGAKVDAKDSEGVTALHMAAQEERIDPVNVLLMWGADVNAAQRDGRTTLHNAVRFSNVNVVKALLEKGAKVNATKDDATAPLHAAAIVGHADVAEVLLEQGANIDAVTSDRATALHYAAAFGHASVAKTLLKRQASFRIKDADGKTAFQHATEHAKESGNFEVVRTFQEFNLR